PENVIGLEVALFAIFDVQVLEGVEAGSARCIDVAYSLNGSSPRERFVDSVLAQQRPHATDFKHATILEPTELGDEATAAKPCLGTRNIHSTQLKKRLHPVEHAIRIHAKALSRVRG